MLITKPSESAALETFVLERCATSVHTALITLWHCQAALADLAADPRTASFQICKRLINRCQTILFDDQWEGGNALTAASAGGTGAAQLALMPATQEGQTEPLPVVLEGAAEGSDANAAAAAAGSSSPSAVRGQGRQRTATSSSSNALASLSRFAPRRWIPLFPATNATPTAGSFPSASQLHLHPHSHSSANQRSLTPYSPFGAPPAPRYIHPANMHTTLVGIGALLGSAPGLPALVEAGGYVAVQQGARPPPDEFRRLIERVEDDGEEIEDDGDGDEEGFDGDEDAGDDEGEDEEGDTSAERKPHAKEASAGSASTGHTSSSSGSGAVPAPSRLSTNAAPVPSSASSTSTTLTIPTAATPAPPSTSSSTFSSFASRMSSFRDRAAGAIGDAFNQTFQIVDPASPGHSAFSSTVASLGSTGANGKGRSAAASASKGKSSLTGRAAAGNAAKKTTGSSGAEAGNSNTRNHAAIANSRSVPNLNRVASGPSGSGPSRGASGSGSNASRSNSAFFNQNLSGSTLALSNYHPHPSSSSVDSLVAVYPRMTRFRMLRVHYSRTQTDFLAQLQDITTRLLVLPKPARLSALRHELTHLNHQLPKEVCFPLWCQCTKDAYAGPTPRKQAQLQSGESASGAEGATQAQAQSQAQARPRHHRVVRIDPSEAVVLNSADRVPYMLHVEVLNNDLDFDPDRRANRETLKKLIAKEEDHRRRRDRRNAELGSLEQQGAKVSQDGDESTNAGEPPKPPPKDLPRLSSLRSVVADESDSGTPADGLSRAPSSSGHGAVAGQAGQTGAEPGEPAAESSSPAAEETPEEADGIDLTEQAYGADLGKFGEDDDTAVSDEEEEDYNFMNRTHDAAVWGKARRMSKVAPAGSVGGSGAPGSPTMRRKQDFSLDDYSERMRTAAIMLAQLNTSTNAGAYPIVTQDPHVSATAQGGWSSWIMGTSWAAPTKKSEPGQASAGIPVGTSSSTNGAAPPSTSAAAPTQSSSMMGPPVVGGGVGKLMQADAESIRKRIMQEMMALEEERMSRTKNATRKRSVTATVGSGIEDEATVLRAVNKDDPSAAHFRESWALKKARIRANSPYGHLPNWDVFSVIIKTGADLRQEQLAVQLINEFGRIFHETNSKCWVRYFRIVVTSESSGLMETITDAISIHSIKKDKYSEQVGGQITTYSLYDHYCAAYGHPNSNTYKKAQDNFMKSLAAYSIISYLLQLKDRHNGNILIDHDGHVIHIDFGFMLGISPGGVGFEAAPFKMPQEYIDILGGMDSPKFDEFRVLMRQAFKDVRKHAERIIMIVELMQKGA